MSETAAPARPVKTVRLGQERFSLTGLSPEDPYFQGIGEPFEEEFQEILRHLVAPDHLCVDIGANIGVKTLALSRHLPEGRVLAIEPNPEVAALLRGNVAANGLTNVEVVQAAIGGQDGEVFFNAASAYGHIAEAGTAVPLRRLETVLDDAHMPRVDFIKMDVEGFELPILQDALDLIGRHRALVMLEFNAWCQMAHARLNPREVMGWIFDHFRFVAAVGKGPGQPLFQPVGPGAQLYLLHRNMLQDGCVTDLLVTNDPARFPGLSAPPMRPPAPPPAEERLAAVEAQLAGTTRTLAYAQAEIAALRNSTSWKLTAPLRWAARLRSGKAAPPTR